MSTPEQTQAPDEAGSAESSQPGRVRRIVSAPGNAVKAVGGGFRWAGKGVASQTKSAGHSVGTKLGNAGGGVTGAAKKPIEGFNRRFGESPWVGIAVVCGVVFAVAWIGWAIYVGSENGGNAALGVIISWPAVIMGVALILAPFVGLWLLVRHLQGDQETSPPIAGGAPDDAET